MSDTVQVGSSFLVGFVSSSVFVLALFIGFCIIIGFTKTKQTAGAASGREKPRRGRHASADALPRAVSPRGPADQLKAPELLEAAAA